MKHNDYEKFKEFYAKWDWNDAVQKKKEKEKENDLLSIIEMVNFFRNNIPGFDRLNWRDSRFIQMVKEMIVLQDLER